MRHLLTILAALFICSAPLHAQTLKSLMFNSTNGQVVANTGTNVLTFTNLVSAKSLTLAIGTNQYIYADDSIAEFFVPIHMESSQGISFTTNAAATTRTNLGIPLPALTNTSNVTAMRALGGSTNTNEPYSGTVALTNTNVLTFSNGVLLRIQ